MPANDDAAPSVVDALQNGARRVVVPVPRAGDLAIELATLVRSVEGRVLVACEFDRLRACLAALAGNDAGSWPHPGRVVVGNYERLGLNARFADPDAFGLVVMMPRLGQNARSAGVVAERFDGAAIVQYAWGDADIVADATVRRADSPIPFRRAS